MILKASQRGGPRALAAYLMADRDNDHVSLHELRGFISDDLHGAMAEVHAVAHGTRCRQCVFSLILNPPKDATVPIGTLVEVADRAEEALGLTDQPRAIVIHEKEGRHAHVVWSRIDAQTMTAINLPFFKSRLNALSKELYLEHGWDLPEGHRTNGWKNPLNFTLAEWQQAKRLDLDPREVKQAFQDAWRRSDNLPTFRHALEEHGYYLAKGDRRGFVAVDIAGNVFSLSRFAGVRPKDLQAQLGDPARLPDAESVRVDLRKRVSARLRGHLAEDRKAKQAELDGLKADLRKAVMAQRADRALLQSKQRLRWREESKDRASRFRRGLGIVLDVLSGRLFRLRRQNEAEAHACLVRDRAQREQLHQQQMKERAPYQQRIDAAMKRQRAERQALAQSVASVLRLNRQQAARAPDKTSAKGMELGL